jgi:hypothetical protein
LETKIETPEQRNEGKEHLLNTDDGATFLLAELLFSDGNAYKSNTYSL